MKAAIIAGCVVLSVLYAPGAHATEDFCAVVLKPPAKVVRDKEYNPDGWLALRQGPGTQYDIITTLREGDFLEADTAMGDDNNKHEWVHILSVPRINGKNGSYIRGWVRGKYIQDFACPEDQANEAPKQREQWFIPGLPDQPVMDYKHQ